MKNLVSVSLLITSSMFLACGSSGGAGGDTKGSDTAATADDSGKSHPLNGQQAPDFTVASQNNQGSTTLSKLSGKVVVVDFWATWCGPCKKSFPKLQELNVKYKASGLEIVGISEDDEKGGIADFGSTLGAKFFIGWDQDKSIAGKWHVEAMPTSFVIDKKGIVRFVHAGYHDGDEAEIEKEVKGLL